MTLATVEVPVLQEKKISLTARGVTPLIQHAWSQEAKDKILGRQQGKTQNKKARDPVREFLDSLYWITKPYEGDTADWNVVKAYLDKSRFGVPAAALKQCAIAACSHVTSITKVFCRTALHLDTPDELLPIIGSTPELHESTVRIGQGTGDLRYRGIFRDWSVEIPILITGAISVESVANLFKIGGNCVGIGDWRPETNGQYGRFTLE